VEAVQSTSRPTPRLPGDVACSRLEAPHRAPLVGGRRRAAPRAPRERHPNSLADVVDAEDAMNITPSVDRLSCRSLTS
jgi:hypothetical protein